MDNDLETNGSLSQSLGRMSLNPTQNEAHIPSSDENTAIESSHQIQQPSLRKASSTQSLKSRSPDPSKRVSSAPGHHQHNSSPLSKRKSYGTLDKREQQTTPSKPNFRRSSSATQSPKASNISSASLPIPEDEPAPATAASVAAQYLSQELQQLNELSGINSQTLVLIHDACYGHRFSRPKTSKTSLSLIVERPERIQACISGIAAAYIRLGQRHKDGLHPPHPQKSPPTDVPFAIRRSTRSIPLTSSSVTAVHGVKWMQELSVMCDAAEQRLASGGKELTRPDTPSGGVAKPRLHEGDLYLCKESMEAFQGALGGVMDGIDAVFRNPVTTPHDAGNTQTPKRVFVCVRPPGHHCSADMPSGFCWLNNVHVGIEYAAQTYGLTHAAIIDFDLHHGDGSQTITWERNVKSSRAHKNTPLSKKLSIGYFSLHDINSYPCEYGDQDKVQNASICIENAHNQTVWNVHLQPWKTEAEFWQLYEKNYSILFEKAKGFLKTHTQRLQALGSNVVPKSAIFISAGFDASEWEGEGMQRHKVNVPTEFYARFSKDVIRVAEDPTTGANGRVISVLEGGYSDRALMSGAMSHVCGLASVDGTSPAKGVEDVADASLDSSVTGYDRLWWSASNLAEYETTTRPFVEPIARKMRSQELSTFATPTQSFAAKAVDPSKIYRSISGALPTPEPARPPTPPPPDVYWSIATREMQKLLLPGDRSINSYRHDELSEPRVKRERHSAIGLPANGTNEKKQLRGRKAAIPENDSLMKSNEGLQSRELSASRRRTIDSLPISVESATALVSDRPRTSDSKAQSDTSVAGNETTSSSRRTSRATSPTKRLEPQTKVHRTRRVSGAKTDLMPKDPNAKPPPIPRVPTKFQPTQPNRISMDNEKLNGNDEVEAITSGIKRIIIKPSKTVEPSEPSKQTRKAAVPRGSKSTALKPVTGRTQKPTKMAPTTDANRPLQKTNANSTMSTLPQSNEDFETSGMQTRSENILSQSIASQSTGPPIQSYGESIHQTSDDLDAIEQSAVGYRTQEAPTFHPSGSRTSLRAAQLDGTLSPKGDSTKNETRTGTKLTTTSLQGGDLSSGFIAYDPSVDYATSESRSSTLIKNEEPLTWLPPNTNTPVKAPIRYNKPTRENLPKFSATGAIPFGQPSSASQGAVKQEIQTQPELHDMNPVVKKEEQGN